MYNSLITALNEAIDYENGKGNARVMRFTVSPVPEYDAATVKAVRGSLGLTQSAFAQVMGVSVKTVEAWEMGQNKSAGAARRLLSLLQKEPAILSRFNIISA